jgi:pimeloyl-ACP methyl ester carboxylesterase
MVAQQPVYCSGYRPYCSDDGRDSHNFSLGAYLSAYCSSPPVSAEARQVEDTAESQDPAYRAVFGSSPIEEACSGWGVSPAPAVAVGPTNVPMLLMSGQFDSFSLPADTARTAASLGAHAYAVTIPANTHNTLGFLECAITMRNQWTRHTSQAPKRTLCSHAAPLAFK